ncbi:hypothetical protein [Acidithiobacillus thiooxidans]|uniref:hypothetical protein n=1 Tax=Acidithiobacillus thiooxidans TaxID=930 RepID=UPI00111E4633|nr:hypothetical protein [Acidithiobacillus thiooxidans]
MQSTKLGFIISLTAEKDQAAEWKAACETAKAQCQNVTDLQKAIPILLGIRLRSDQIPWRAACDEMIQGIQGEEFFTNPRYQAILSA